MTQRQAFVDTANNIIQALPEDLRGEVSDGYHSFNQLYEHRITLFMALCHVLMDRAAAEDDLGTCPRDEKRLPWKSRTHSDGTVWPGWFIAGINTEPGQQISYHLPESKWESLYVPELDKAPHFDGHTPEDVLKRLAEY